MGVGSGHFSKPWSNKEESYESMIKIEFCHLSLNLRHRFVPLFLMMKLVLAL